MNKEPKFTDTQKPLVAIHCMVYNHAPYLRECFEGFVMQQTSFPFVAIVHDDASTDNSAEIIREYEAKYPHIFKPIYQIENQHAKPGVSVVKIINNAIQQTGAKYIALCEGDDYWTDPLKLQRQVDFLEANPEYSFCCHRFKIFKHAEKKYINEYAHKLYINDQNLIINEDTFYRAWTTQWLTTVARTDVFVNVCNETLEIFHRGLDVYIYFLLLQHGNGISINQTMGVYRWHSNGASIGRTDLQHLKDGYAINKNLFNIFPDKLNLRNRVKYYAIRLLGYCSLFSKQDQNFYTENYHLYDNLKERTVSFLFFITPPCMWRLVRRIYSSFIFKN